MPLYDQSDSEKNTQFFAAFQLPMSVKNHEKKIEKIMQNLGLYGVADSKCNRTGGITAKIQDVPY